ncbi:hypothetical protein HYQ44_009091 [Verticillium longisporum]|nr:hypothetical protein HYQ44_009091 [Verticillium longisporum]
MSARNSTRESHLGIHIRTPLAAIGPILAILPTTPDPWPGPIASSFSSCSPITLFFLSSSPTHTRYSTDLDFQSLSFVNTSASYLISPTHHHSAITSLFPESI